MKALALASRTLAQYNKALVPLLVGAILEVLSTVGVTKDMTVAETVTMAVTAGLVWLVPNSKK